MHGKQEKAVSLGTWRFLGNLFNMGVPVPQLRDLEEKVEDTERTAAKM